MTSSAVGGPPLMAALNCSVLAIRLRCDSEAPLESPVVPPVYCRNNRSSPFCSTLLKVRPAPSASASANGMAPLRRGSTGGPGSFAALPSPGPAVITVSSGVEAITSATVADEPANTTITLTPAS